MNLPQTYCTTRYLGMTVRLLYKEFLELYAILCIPTSYEQQTTKLLLQHPDPKAASAFLLQVRLLTVLKNHNHTLEVAR